MKNEQGFTLIEVMVAAVVLAIGLVGVMGMQAVSSITNRRAQDIRVATELADSTLERLKVDAVSWVGDTTAIPATTWLGKGLRDENIGNWTLPPVGEGDGNNMFNDMGLRATTSGAIPAGAEAFVEKNARYCIQYRLSWVLQGDLARVEVRALWPSNQAGELVLNTDCASLNGLAENSLDLQFEWVKVSGMVRWNQSGGIPTGPRA